MKSISVLLLTAVSCVSPALAATITLHFDELGTSSPVSLPVSESGVTFGFSPGSAVYNGSIGAVPGFSTVNVSDPALNGPTSGTLTLDFAIPITILEFDIAMESVDPIPNAYTVTIGTNSFSGDTTPMMMYSEGSFSYPGQAAFSSASITFSNAAPEFALDNLTFGTPEPGTGLPIVGGLLALAAAARIRSLQTSSGKQLLV